MTARSFDLHRTERRATEAAALIAIALIRAAVLTGYRARDTARTIRRWATR